MAKNIESEETKKTKRKSVAGKRLAKARHEKEIPLEDIAEELLVSTNVLSNLEKNTKTLFMDTNIDPEIDKNQNIVIKVRTESFDQSILEQ